MLAIVYAANVSAVTRNKEFALQESIKHATRQAIPTFLVVTDGLKNAKLSQNVHLELFDPQVRFLTDQINTKRIIKK